MRRERLAAKLLLQIHDELVFEVPSAEIDILAQLVAEEMSTAYPLAVPLKVDIQSRKQLGQWRNVGRVYRLAAIRQHPNLPID